MNEHGKAKLVWRRLLKPGEVEIIEPPLAQIRVERLLSADEIMRQIIDVTGTMDQEARPQLEPPV